MGIYPSYDELSDSPTFGDDEFGVKIALAKGALSGAYPADAEWPIFGACRLSRAILDELGPAPMALMRLLVRHKETGQAWVCSVTEDGVDAADEIGADETGGELVAVTSFFALDLKRCCHFVEPSGRYWVIALLGTMVSPVVAIDVPVPST